MLVSSVLFTICSHLFTFRTTECPSTHVMRTRYHVNFQNETPLAWPIRTWTGSHWHDPISGFSIDLRCLCGTSYFTPVYLKVWNHILPCFLTSSKHVTGSVFFRRLWALTTTRDSWGQWPDSEFGSRTPNTKLMVRRRPIFFRHIGGKLSCSLISSCSLRSIVLPANPCARSRFFEKMCRIFNFLISIFSREKSWARNVNLRKWLNAFFLNNYVCIAKRHRAGSGSCYRLRIFVIFSRNRMKKKTARNEKLSP